jgi:aspartate dehydrogenase
MARLPGVRLLERPASLAELKPNLVVEAAGRDRVAAGAPAGLRYAQILIVASTNALCDETLVSGLSEIAEACGRRI